MLFLLVMGSIFLSAASFNMGASSSRVDKRIIDKTGQKTNTEKISVAGPINSSDLPDGSYSQVRDEHFAFVKRESKDPFDQKIIAVRSNKRIPEYFTIGKIAPKEKR